MGTWKERGVMRMDTGYYYVGYQGLPGAGKMMYCPPQSGKKAQPIVKFPGTPDFVVWGSATADHKHPVEYVNIKRKYTWDFSDVCALYKKDQRVLIVNDRDYADTLGYIASGPLSVEYKVPGRIGRYYEVWLPGVNKSGLTFWEEDIQPLTEAEMKRLWEDYLQACHTSKSASGSGSTSPVPSGTGLPEES